MRILILLGGGLIFIFGSEHLELAGAGPLAVVAAAFVSSWVWSTLGWEIEDVSHIVIYRYKLNQTVSYTHLDVYKRQVLVCVCSLSISKRA